MRLAPVTGTPFKFQCLHCGKWKTSDKDTLADLDGEPFKAYYCGECNLQVNGGNHVSHDHSEANTQSVLD